MSGIRGEFHAGQIYRMENADRLSAALAAIRWGPQALARTVNVDERTVRRWASGQNEPPAAILAWLLDLAAYHRAHPAPGRGGEGE